MRKSAQFDVESQRGKGAPHSASVMQELEARTVTELRVTHDIDGVKIAAALQFAEPGDTILLCEGTHYVDSVEVNNLRIIGDGDPTKILVKGLFLTKGHVTLEGFTLESTANGNSVVAREETQKLILRGMTIRQFPDSDYPALYAMSTSVEMENTRIIAINAEEPDIAANFLESNLLAQNCDFTVSLFLGSTATLENCSFMQLLAQEQSQINVVDQLVFMTPAGRKSIICTNGSVLVAPTMIFRNIAAAEVNESFMQVQSVQVLQDGPLEICHAASELMVPAELCAFEELEFEEEEDSADALGNEENEELAGGQADGEIDPYGIEPTVAPITNRELLVLQEECSRTHAAVVHVPEEEPDFGEWYQTNSELFETVILDEGDYFIDPERALSVTTNIIGRGNPNKIKVHGVLAVTDGRCLTLAGFSIVNDVHSNLLYVDGESDLTAKNVVFISSRGGNVINVVGSRATFSSCLVKCDENQDLALVAVAGGSEAYFEDSQFDCLGAFEGSTIRLESCGCQTLLAKETSSIESTTEINISKKRTDRAQLTSLEGSSLRLRAVTVEDKNLECEVQDSSLELGTFGETDEVLQVSTQGQCSVDVGRGIVLVDGKRLEIPLSAETVEVEEGEPLAELHELIGLESVKREFTRFMKMVEFNQKRVDKGLSTSNMVLHSMFLGNPGTGKTTVARLAGRALHRAGVLQRDTVVEVQRHDLVAQHVGATALKTQRVLESARGGILFVDEAYTLAGTSDRDFGREALDTILTFMENYRDDIMVIFAGYTKNMQDLLALNEGLKSRIPNVFHFEDYTGVELVEIGLKQIAAGQYVVDEQAYARAVERQFQRSSDHSNGRWIRNFNEKLFGIVAQRVIEEDGDDIQTILDEDLLKVSGSTQGFIDESVQRLLEQLDALEGLESVKTWVRSLVKQTRADQRLAAHGMEIGTSGRHMIFTGNPGTGKTTVARIIAEIFHALGILESTNVVEVDRSDLVGRYLGETEKLTTKVIDSAMGGVLFIDEAYQLAKGTERDFGIQAIETLLPRLENDRMRFVAILAGYTKEMEEFLQTNPGLDSRLPYRIEFPDYTPEEVGRIVVRTLSRQWRLNEELAQQVAAVAYELQPFEKRGNGRWARNFAEQVQNTHKQWIVDADPEGEEIFTITDDSLFEVGRQYGVYGL